MLFEGVLLMCVSLGVFRRMGRAVSERTWVLCKFCSVEEHGVGSFAHNDVICVSDIGCGFIVDLLSIV